MRPRRARPLLVAGAALLVLAACSSSVTGSATAEGSSPGGDTAARAGGTATGIVPAGLEPFYSQSITWGPCDGYASTADDASLYSDKTFDCARVQVPLDYAAPTVRSISVAVLRIKASGNRIGSLLVDPGGPGGSGMSLAANLKSTVAGTPLGQRFDLVGFDPRGIGASEPAVDCVTDAEADANRKDLDLDTSPAGVAATEAREKTYAGECASRVGSDVLAHVGTVDAVQDMDVLRSVLGDQKLSYLGFSYGTSLGRAYAEKFSTNVRALVLDGALDPAADPVETLVRQGRGFQGAFDAYAADCAKRSSCPLGTDPAAASAAFQALVRPLVGSPARTKDPRGLGYDDAVTGTIQALYSQQLWDPLTRGLTELQGGRGDTLLALADLYEGRDANGKYSTEQDGFNAVRCVDAPPTTDRTVVDTAETRYRQAAPFLDDGRGTGNAPLDVCAFWPVPPSGAPHTPVVTGLPQVVVISTTGDPATPYQAGVQLAKQLGARLVTYKGDQHTVALSGVSCIDDAVDAYLVDLTVPADGLTC
jgi:pimeloyl-ACP methyl ester carboxylesterase